MLEEFEVRDIEELSGEAVELKKRVDELTESMEKIKLEFSEHQHSGSDGSVKIYNESIRLKPGSAIQGGFIALGNRTSLTISAGEITINSSFHEVDTESAASTDDLVTINTDGAVRGQLLVITPDSGTRTIVAKDGTGNLRLNGDFSLSGTNDTLTLIWNGLRWMELSRTIN